MAPGEVKVDGCGIKNPDLHFEKRAEMLVSLNRFPNDFFPTNQTFNRAETHGLLSCRPDKRSKEMIS